MIAEISDAQAAIQRARRVVADALVQAAMLKKNADIVRSLTGINMVLVGLEYYVADVLEYVEILERPSVTKSLLPDSKGARNPNAGT